MTTITSSPDVLDFEIRRGDTIAITVTVQDDQAQAIDLTGYNVKSNIVDASNQAVGEFLSVISDAASGEVFLYLEDGVSDLLSTGCKYDVEVWINTNIPELGASKNVVSTVISGTFTITNDITDDSARTPD